MPRLLRLFIVLVAMLGSTTLTVVAVVPTRVAEDPQVDLGILKSVYYNSQPAPPGETMVYQLSISNSPYYDAATAENLIVEDDLPAGFAYVSSEYHMQVAEGGSTTFVKQAVTPTIVGQTITWSLPDLQDRTLAYILVEVAVGASLSPSDVITNTATITSTVQDSNTANNTVSCATTIPEPVTDTSVIEDARGDPPGPGGQFGYYLHAQNEGNVTVPNVLLTNTLPIGVEAVGWGGYQSDPNLGLVDLGLTPTVQSDAVIWHLGDLAGGYESLVIPYLRIPSTASPGDVLTFKASIGTTSDDSALANNTTVITMTVADRLADLYTYTEIYSATSATTATLSALSSGFSMTVPLQMGDELAYQIVVANYGQSEARDVVITQVFPEQLRYVGPGGEADAYLYPGVGSSAPYTITPTVQGHTLVWDVGTLYGENALYLYPKFEVVRLVQPGDLLVNAVSATTSDIDADLDDNGRATVNVVVEPASPTQWVFLPMLVR